MASNEPTSSLVSGPLNKAILALALPVLATSVLQSLNMSINTFWLGQLLGKSALAATANANTVMFAASALVFGLSMIGSVLVGQAMGDKDLDAARRVVGTSMTTLLVVGMALAGAGWLLAPDILVQLETPDEVKPLALTYLRIMLVAAPWMLLLVGLMAALRGSGDVTTPLLFMGASVLLDIVLNPVLILGIGPAPRMGIAGSAVATAAASLTGLVGMIAYIYARDLPLRLRGAQLAYLRPAWPLVRTIAVKGIPMGLQLVVVAASAVAMLNLVNREGIDATAAYGVAEQIWVYVQMPGMAIAAAVTVIAAQNIGAGHWERVASVTWHGIVLNLLLTALIILVLIAVDRGLLTLFGIGRPAIEIAERIILLGSWSFLFLGVVVVLFGTMRANGIVVVPLIILLVALLPVRVGFAAGGRAWLGTDALWLSFPISAAVGMTFAYAYYAAGRWEATSLSGAPNKAPARRFRVR